MADDTLDALTLEIAPGPGVVARFAGCCLLVVPAAAGPADLVDDLIEIARSLAPDEMRTLGGRIADRVSVLPAAERPTVCGVVVVDDEVVLSTFGSCDARVTRSAGVETIHCHADGHAEYPIESPFDDLAVAADLAVFTDRAIRTDLRSGVVPGGGFRLRTAAAAREPEPSPAVPAQAPPAFEAMSLIDVQIDDPRPALPTVESASRAAGNGEDSTDDAVMVTGFMCSRGHFNGPDAAYCSLCGISMVLLTRRGVEGVRPPLGYIVRDDGATFLLDRDYVIGRNPEQDADVQAGRALALGIPDADRSVSRCHARIVLDGWNVCVLDQQSANGTFVSGPNATEWHRVSREEPTRIGPGTRILIGGRTFVFDSHYRAERGTVAMENSSAPSIPGYEVGERIGEGGFSVVYAASDLTFFRTVAIKVLHVRIDDDTLTRFEQERRALGAVSGHPHIVDVYTAGMDADGHAYLVMAFMAGGSVAGKARPWPDVVAMGIKLAGALESAHRVGVLHRDIKPENVLLSAYGEPELADFGIARVEGESADPQPGFVTASPLHAAPEVLDRKPSSIASEVYSLGSTLYAMLAGSPAFEGAADDHPLALVYRVTTEPVPDLRVRPHGVPGPVCDVVEAAMAKHPAARPHSARDLGRALQGAQRAMGVAPTPMHVIVDNGSTTVVEAGEPIPAPRAAVGAARPDPTAERPGARLASRPLHFIWIADSSESMILDGKITALNDAIRSSIPRLREVAAENPHAQVLVRCCAFSTGVRWTIPNPVPVDELEWIDLRASGYTDTGAALTAVAEQLRVPPMEPRALPPVLVLVSDGHPTDDFEAGLAALQREPWGQKAVRISIAIGRDADLDALARFMDNPELRPLVAADARQLAELVRWVSTAATRAATAPPATEPANIQMPLPPAGRPPAETQAW